MHGNMCEKVIQPSHATEYEGSTLKLMYLGPRQTKTLQQNLQSADNQANLTLLDKRDAKI